MMLFLAAAVAPATIVMFAILAGMFYFAWSAGWLVGLVFTAWLVALLSITGLLVARRVKAAQADSVSKSS
jgi:hypothetical protein